MDEKDNPPLECRTPYCEYFKEEKKCNELLNDNKDKKCFWQEFSGRCLENICIDLKLWSVEEECPLGCIKDTGSNLCILDECSKYSSEECNNHVISGVKCVKTCHLCYPHFTPYHLLKI
jgi:hypothetical protein